MVFCPAVEGRVERHGSLVRGIGPVDELVHNVDLLDVKQRQAICVGDDAHAHVRSLFFRHETTSENVSNAAL